MDYNGCNCSYSVREASLTEFRGRYGLVPHLITLKDTIGKVIMFESLCAMDGCGIRINKTKDGTPIRYTQRNQQIFFSDGDWYVTDKYGDVIWLEKDEPFFFRYKVLQQPTIHHYSVNEWEALTGFVDTGLEI